MYGAETWTLQNADTCKLLKRGAGEGWADRARNEDMLHGVEEDRNILHKVEGMKATWMSHIFHRNLPSKTLYCRKQNEEVTGR